ncbi:hypothetical protein IC744_01900 [Microbacterium hominis]|uniref:hypothetical protein n=1 Tax=Microbacterium hominis TaxID=162426 RepID=UPI00168B7DDD|nr:hypothetical protein [Microbacterium hominis]QOC25169.1 hypothetical protein IC745_12550 [Microbacterium hominis]QOC29204.1 hypothetical protein IC744_01900 [Microbacterium hominis]
MDTTNSSRASEDIPAADIPDASVQPETQGLDPLAANLGEDGQGDLAPEDLDPAPFDNPEHPATPADLRDELPRGADGP